MAGLGIEHLPLENVVKERRRGRRFPLSLPCSVSSPSSEFSQLTGATLNMSRSGVLVAFRNVEPSCVLPTVGEIALVLIDLPVSQSFSPRCLECMAQVVRISNQGTDHPEVAMELRRVRVMEKQEVGLSRTEGPVLTAPRDGWTQ